MPQGQRLIWYDDFDGTTLDPNKWSYDLGTGDWGWGNNEMQVRVGWCVCVCGDGWMGVRAGVC